MPYHWVTLKNKAAAVGFFAIYLTTAGCLHTHQPNHVPDPCPSLVNQISALENENKVLQQKLKTSDQQARRLEREVSTLKIQTLEQEALINDLRRRSARQQMRLDAAIIEVVRAKAKLRSIESKAEAASSLAEAELAVQALKRQQPATGEVALEEISTVDQLLNMSIKEFKARNFGGALYLANQTKAQVRAAQIRLDKGSKPVAIEDESSFAEPLPLVVIKASNLRDGPDIRRNIIGRLKKDDMLTGYSFKDSWIRVETQTGLTGWIFQSLVEAR